MAPTDPPRPDDAEAPHPEVPQTGATRPAGPADEPSPVDGHDRPLTRPHGWREWLVFPALVAIRGYQLLLRPFLPPTCRFFPSCSRYSVDAYRTHGVWRGTLLTAWRILRCNPLSRGGYDPVPPRSGRGRPESPDP